MWEGHEIGKVFLLFWHLLSKVKQQFFLPFQKTWTLDKIASSKNICTPFWVMYNVHAPCKNAPRNIKPSSYSTPHFFLLEGEISNRIMPPKRETQKKTLSDFFPLGPCSNQKRVFFLQSNFLYIQLFLHNIRGLL